MPLFNVLNTTGKGERGHSIAEDEDILNFLNPQDNVYVSAKDALRNSDIYAIVFQLSSDLAGAKMKSDSKKVQRLLDNPTEVTNQSAFWQAMYTQLLLGGEAFAYRWRNRNGQDTRLEYLRPSQVSTLILEHGNGLVYNVDFDDPNVGRVQAIPSRDMIHLRLMSTNGGKTGLSPLYALKDELDIKEASNDLSKSALRQSVLSPGILKLDAGGLSSGKEKAIRSRAFAKQIRASKGGPIVVDKLEEYTPLEIKSDVSKILAQTDWTQKQIAKVYGMDDALLNGQGDAQSSIEMIDNHAAQNLNRFAHSVVSELTDKFGVNVTIDFALSLDPGGYKNTKHVSQLVKDGVLTSGEAKWLLKSKGLIPKEMPDILEDNLTKKGGEP